MSLLYTCVSAAAAGKAHNPEVDTGGLNIGQLTWNEPNKWLVPFFVCYHTDQDSYDGWRIKLQPQLELIAIKG